MYAQTDRPSIIRSERVWVRVESFSSTVIGADDWRTIRGSGWIQFRGRSKFRPIAQTTASCGNEVTRALVVNANFASAASIMWLLYNWGLFGTDRELLAMQLAPRLISCLRVINRYIWPARRYPGLLWTFRDSNSLSRLRDGNQRFRTFPTTRPSMIQFCTGIPAVWGR